MSHSNCLLLRTIIFLSFFSFVIPQSVKAADTEGDPVDWTVRFDNSQSQWSEVYVQILSEDLMQTTGDFKGNKMKDIGGGIFEYQFRWTYGKALIGFNSSAVLSPFQGAVLSEWAGVPMYYDSKGYLGKEQTYTFCFSDDFAWSDKSAITAKMFDDADGYWVDHTGSDGLLPRTCTVTRNENYYIWFSFSGVEMKNPHVLIYMESCPSNLVCAPYEDNAEYMHPTGEVTEHTVYFQRYGGGAPVPMEFHETDYRIFLRAGAWSETCFYVATDVMARERSGNKELAYIYVDDWSSPTNPYNLDLKQFYKFSSHDASAANSMRQLSYSFASRDYFSTASNPDKFKCTVRMYDPLKTGAIAVGPYDWTEERIPTAVESLEVSDQDTATGDVLIDLCGRLVKSSQARPGIYISGSETPRKIVVR